MLLEKGSWADAFDGADNAALHLAARCAPDSNTRLQCAIIKLPCLQGALHNIKPALSPRRALMPDHLAHW